MFCVLTFIMAFWSLSFFLLLLSDTRENALLWMRMLMLGAVFLSPAFLHFIVTFLNQNVAKKKEIIIAYSMSIALSFFTFTPYFIKDMAPKLQFKFWPVTGPVFDIYLFLFHGYYVYSLYLIYKNYRTFSLTNINQTNYIILGSVIAFLGGSINYLACYDNPVEPYGLFLISLYIIAFAYAIIKYQLMDLKVVIRRGTIFSAVYFAIFTIPIFFAIYGETVFENVLGKKWWIGFFIAGGILSYVAQMVYNYLRQKTESRFLKEQRIYNSYLRYASNDMIRFRDPKRLQARVANVLSNDIRINHVRLFIYNPEKDIFELVAMRGVERRRQTNRIMNKSHPIIRLLLETQENILYDNLPVLRSMPGINIKDIEEEMRALGAAIILPNFSQGELLGFIALSRKKGHQVYTKDDINVLTTLANQVALAMENASLYQNLERKIQERTWELNNALNMIQEDLKMAKSIQEKFLPMHFSDIKQLGIFIKYFPMSEIGGDIYDVTEISDSYIRIFVADATGHGIQAALATMLIKSEYDKLKKNIRMPSLLLETFNNEFLYYYKILLIFFTCIVIDIDLRNKRLVYASAGHPDQILITGSGIERLHKTGRIIGIVEDNTYAQREMEYTGDDQLLLFTDGLFEEINDRKEQFGEARMLETIEEHADEDIDYIIDRLIGKLKEFTGRESKFNVNDDILIVGVKGMP